MNANEFQTSGDLNYVLLVSDENKVSPRDGHDKYSASIVKIYTEIQHLPEGHYFVDNRFCLRSRFSLARVFTTRQPGWNIIAYACTFVIYFYLITAVFFSSYLALKSCTHYRRFGYFKWMLNSLRTRFDAPPPFLQRCRQTSDQGLLTFS